MQQRAYAARLFLEQHDKAMTKTILPLLIACSLLCNPFPGLAQGEDCASATPLSDVNSWCSGVGAFNNEGATEDGPSPGCFPNTQQNLDVWFSFVAEATDVNISVSGATGQSNGGTLELPQFAIYEGDCGSLASIGCFSDALGDNSGQLFAGPLTIGETYYIQVSARNGNQGSFQLCINNFNAIPDPSSDCNTGVILCDKSSFTVERVTGVGNDFNEISNLACDTDACSPEESGSAWYKWTCDEAGSLTFSLTPLNPVDDLDFVVYELPNGLNDCSDKIDLRCMFSGEQVGAPFETWEPCAGATGLEQGDPDVTEGCGCDPGDNNFVAQVEMVAGRSYALVVNNFSQSGSGFSVEFGGTGTFLGPEASFRTNTPTDTVCLEESITFTDESTSVSGITDWEWDFGIGASPGTANAQGPHNVNYSTPGLKNVLLRVTTQDGCVVTAVQSFYAECCEGEFEIEEMVSDLNCPEDSTGAIELSVNNDFPPYDFSWSTGAVNSSLENLASGTYTVTITDGITCDTVLSYELESPPPIDVDTLIGMPSCDGGTDGSIELSVEGGTPPYEFRWESSTSFTSENTLLNLPVGDYDVAVRDANGCIVELVIPVRELELELDPVVTELIDPSCTGFTDGSIIVSIANGQPPYQYDFNDGNGFVEESSLVGLPAGTYMLDVLDDNLCQGSFTFVLEDPPPLAVSFDLENISCFGAADAILEAQPAGGVGDYSLLWGAGQTDSVLTMLDEGSYSVTVTDGNGCEATGDTSFQQPPPLSLDVTDVIDLLCFGDENGEVAVLGQGGVPPYEYSVDGMSFQVETTFSGLTAGSYPFTVMDANGCTATAEATVRQPPELTVDAGPDVRIELGFSTNLNATPNNPMVSFEWLPPDSLSCLNCDAPTANPVNSTVYTVTVVDSTGCTASDSVRVGVIKNRPVYAPNAFSPNGDGVNDQFTIYAGPGVSEIEELKIFNRWGGLVFEADSFPPNLPGFGWDGRFRGEPAAIGVYAFYAEVSFIDGESVLIEGDLQLVR
jgi:gliding motility-associated-like protein